MEVISFEYAQIVLALHGVLLPVASQYLKHNSTDMEMRKIPVIVYVLRHVRLHGGGNHNSE